MKKDLFTFKSEKLSKLSIIFIIILDIFVFSIALSGISTEQDKIKRPEYFFPFNCLSPFLNTNDSFSLSKKENIVFSSNSSDSHPLCKQLEEKARAAFGDRDVAKNIAESRRLNKNKYTIARDLKKVRSKYNTELLEVSANQKKAPSSIQQKYHSLLEQETKNKEALEKLPKLNSFKAYKDYTNFIKDHKQQLLDAEKSYKKWYKIKKYFKLLLFILPLLLLTSLVYYFNKKKQLKAENFNNISLIISSHLMFVLSLPVVLGFLGVMYYLLPKELLAQILELLKSIGALFLGFYGLIFLAVLIVFGIVYCLQKFENNRHKKYSVIYKNINASKCFNCKNKVDYRKDKYCSVCGQELQEKCANCNDLKIVNTPHCRHCNDIKK